MLHVGDHNCRAQKAIHSYLLLAMGEENLNINEWMGPRDRSDSEQSFDWLVQCQSFVLHQWPSQTQEMGVSHYGGGASSWMVRGDWWSEIDAAPNRVNVAEDEHIKIIVHKQRLQVNCKTETLLNAPILLKSVPIKTFHCQTLSFIHTCLWKGHSVNANKILLFSV